MPLLVIYKKEPYGKERSFKYFIRYNNNDNIKPLFVSLLQMIGFVKCFDSTEIMSFKVSDKNLLKKYNKIWKKISSLMNREFDSDLCL